MSSMIVDIHDFYAGAGPWIALFDVFVEKYDLSGVVIADHICYKCDSTKEFEAIRSVLEDSSRYMYQSPIAGRRIAYIRLQEDLASVLGPIGFLELSDQKPDGSQKSGFDHIEVYPVHTGVLSLVARLASLGVTLKKVVRPHHTTYDCFIKDEFKLRLEDEKLIEKIQREEML